MASQEAERKHSFVQQATQERIASVTRVEGAWETSAIITMAMERTRNATVEVRRIDAAKEIGRCLILNKGNPVRMIVFVLCVSC